MQQKAIIYCRVSSEKQVTEGDGLGSQEHNCRQYAKLKNYEVVKVFRDEAKSGGVIDRPGINELTNFLDVQMVFGESYVVLIDDISRLARDVEGHFTLKAAIESRNAKLDSPKHDFSDAPVGKLIETVMAASAEYQRNENRLRVIERQRARLEQGYWCFCWVPGYYSKKVSGHGKVGFCEPEQKVILKEALEGLASKRFYTNKDVQDFLQSKDYHRFTGAKQVHPTVVTRILGRAWFYAGFIEYEPWGIKRIKGHHEAIISEETLALIEESMNVKEKPTPHRADLHKDFELRGYAACSECGHLMTSSWSKGRTKSYPYYRCTQPGCVRQHKGIGKNVIDEDFKGLLKDMAAKSETMDLLAAVFNDVWKDRLDSLGEAEKMSEEKIKELDKKIDNLVQKVEATKSKTLTATYERRIIQLEEEREVQKQSEGISKDPCYNFGTAFSVVRNFLQNPLELWNSDEFEDKRTVLKLAFTSVIPFSKENGVGTAPFSLLFELSRLAETDKKAMVEHSSLARGSLAFLGDLRVVLYKVGLTTRIWAVNGTFGTL